MEKGSAQDSVNGLKLYFEDMGSGVQAKTGGGSSPVVASGGPLPVQVKRGRGSGVQPPRCQVEGCELDLSDCKAYYSRHKVCGMHSKSRKVIVAGLEQRFCQQCSRFHQLSEFDQGKRSCRRRLAGHNERRRKPAPALSTRYGNGSSSVFETHGRNRSFVMDFSLYPSLTGSSSERGLGSINRKVLPSPWHGNNFLQGSTTSASYVGGRASSSSGSFSGILDSSSALSLLSNHQPWGSLGLNTSYGPNGTSMAVHPSAAHDAHLANFLSHPWDFKDNQASTSSHHMPPDLCLGQISHRHYSNELEMAQQGGGQFHELELSTGHTSSVDHMHWSL